MGPAISVDSASMAVEASQMMLKHYRGSVLVENNRTVVGIITRNDFLRVITKERTSPDEIRVLQMMSRPVLTIESNATISEAARFMAENKIQELPVMDSDHFVGILCSSDIVRAIVGTTAKDYSVNEEDNLATPQTNHPSMLKSSQTPKSNGS
jgi:CBS domain-containing protein